MFSICHFVSYTVLICFLIFVSATIQDQKAFGSAQSFGEVCLKAHHRFCLIMARLPIFPSWFWSCIIHVTCKLTNDNKEIIV